MENQSGAVINTVYPDNRQLPPATSANAFHFTISSGEIQMLVGAINLLDLVDTTESKDVYVNVSSRFLLSPTAFLRLKNAIDEIAAKMEFAARSNRDA